MTIPFSITPFPFVFLKKYWLIFEITKKFDIKSVYYESGFNIQLLSNTLIIFNKAGHIKGWSYNFKKPMACFDSPSGK